MQVTWYSFREKVFPILKIVLAMIWLANLAHTEAYFSIYILIANWMGTSETIFGKKIGYRYYKYKHYQ